MAMTKPAGVFLQILSIPVMLFGCIDGIANNGGVFGWSVFAIGVALLWAGGKPSRPKN